MKLVARKALTLLAFCCLTGTVAVVGSTGCGTTCSQIAADEEAFRSGGQPVSGPHLALWLPASDLGALATEELARRGAIAVPMGGLGDIAKGLGAVELAPTAVEFVDDGNTGLAARLTIDLRLGGKRVSGMGAVVALEPRVDPGANMLSVGLGPQSLRSVVPTVDKGAQLTLLDSLLQVLPAAARALVPRAAVASSADALLARVVDGGWAALRDHLLSEVGELAAVRVKMADIPVTATWWARQGAHVRIAVQTSLPVAQALDFGASTPVPSTRAALQMSGATLAALANEGMRRGLLPSRFTAKGEPNPTGPVTAGLAWAGGGKPLHVHAWQKSGLCVSARIDGRPTLSVKPGGLEVGVLEGEIADVNGPPLIELGAWLHTLWSEAIVYTTTVAASGVFDLADRHVRFEVLDATLDGDTVALMLEVAATKSRKKGGKREK